jgi:CubicO group peptidase (beta-lactamase class C family)
MKLAPIIFAITLLSGCTVAPSRPRNITRGDYEATKTYITNLIHFAMEKNAVPGLSIALVDDQRIVWAEGFGYADQERKIPATADTLYRVGSISKLFTDTAAMQFAENGKLDIDQPVQKYLPDFAIMTRILDTAAITPRQLMTHHAGLPRDRGKGFMNPNPAPFTKVVADLREDYMAYPPETIFSYSNLGVTLLGNVIQNVADMPYADYMKLRLLAPMGMMNSSFDTGLSQLVPAAKGYRGRIVAVEPPLRDVPAGGLNSSVAELSRFMSMVFAGGTSGEHRILKAETIAEMLRPQNAAVPLDFNFRVGLGWMLSTVGTSTIQNAGTVAHHAGATALFHSQMYILPEHKLGVVVLANSSTAKQVVDHVATEALSLALEAKSGIRQPEHSKVLPADGPISAATMREYVGDYTTLAGFVRIYRDGNGLRANVGAHDFNLVPRSDRMLGMSYALLGFFHLNLGTLGEIGFSRRTTAGRDLLVARLGTQEMLVGQRIVAPTSLGAWRQRLGDYEITNLDGDAKQIERIRLAEERGFLLAEVSMTEAPGQTQRIPLMPLSDGEGLLLGSLNDGGETVRVVTADGEERLAVSGYLLKRIVR